MMRRIDARISSIEGSWTFAGCVISDSKSSTPSQRPFYTKLHGRLLRPLLDADQPPAPPEMRRALTTIERLLGDYVANARLGAAA